MSKRPFAVAAAAVAVLVGGGSAPAGAQNRPPEASIAVDDATPTPGQSITVTMSLCRPRTFALFGVDLLLLGAARADGERAASTTVVIPRTLESGPHAVSGLCLGPDGRPQFLRTDITVEDGDQAPPATTTTSTTAVPPTTAPPTTTTASTTTSTATTSTTTTSTTTTSTTTTTTAPPTTTTTVPPTTVPPTTVPPTTEPGAAAVPPPTDRGSGPGAGVSRSGTSGGRRPGGPAPSPDALAEPVYPVDASAMFEDAAEANGVPAATTPAASSRTPDQGGDEDGEGTGAPAAGDSGGDGDLGAMPTLARVGLGLAAIGGVPVALALSQGPPGAPRRRLRLPFLGERFA